MAREKSIMIDTEGADSAPESPPVLSFEERMLAAMERISARIEAVEEIATRPTFVESPARRNDAAAKTKRMEDAPRDGVPRADTIPLFPNGERVPAMVMAQYTPRFGSGDTVALNLDAIPHGRKDGKTRGELMAEQGVPNGYGEILDRSFLSARTGLWKYRVKFDKRVMPGSNGGIVALYEPELLPA